MSKPSPAAERRIAAVKALHADVLGATPADMNGELHLELSEIVGRILELCPLSRAPRWSKALEDWADMIEAELGTGHEYWAYVQGSVYFGYATLGL